MHISWDMIHPELRIQGKFIQTFLPEMGQTGFEIYDRFISLLDRERNGVLGKMKIEIFHIPRMDRSGMLRVNVYRPKDYDDLAPGVIWCHGGGFVAGNPEQAEFFIYQLISTTPCVVVAPDYRLATEKPYPAALEDCYSALLWLKENADILKVRTNQIFVGGESAGGGLAAALTLYARERKEVEIAYQMPLYPMLDDRMITESSQNNDAPLCNTATLNNCWELYLGDLYGKEDVPAFAAPARNTDFSDLPPAVTFVGNIEPFLDETQNYIDHLKEAGIEAEIKIMPGCFHGFDVMFPWSTPAREARKYWLEHFKYAAENVFKEQKDSVLDELD